MDSIELTGGNVSQGVVRVGDTVHRPAGLWTPAVHALLSHLHSAGFEGAPRPLGIDERPPCGRAALGCWTRRAGQSMIGGLNIRQMFWYNPRTGQSKIIETSIEPNPIRMRARPVRTGYRS
ncbi:hypothetical protein [Spongiactinospora rosea]|uniref:hypothetical protein n=1 Tax=Spongiactinospora rosea TaxID=2248750 RepID=UPI0018F702F2|nr:hypothetical protein [Spongiactinospora rosea]